MKENKSLQPRTSFRQKIILVLFGLSLFFVLLEVGLRFGGFIVLSLQDYRNKRSLRHAGTYKILCLGESTTQGQYPPFLEEILNQRNIKIRFSVIDKGRVGTNTSIILNQVGFYLDEYHPDMVVVMTGINDSGAHMLYEYPTFSMSLRFLGSLKIYKLSRLLWLHMVTKAQEMKLLPSQKDRRYLSTYKPNALTVGLKEVPDEQMYDANLEHALKESLKLNSADNQAYLDLGRLYRREGQLSQARECFKKALELNPKNDQAYLDLGRLYRREGQFSQARECFKKALEFNPKNEQAYLSLGWFYHNQGQLSQARECFKKGLVFNPSRLRLYGALAVIYEASGQAARAQEYYDKTNELRLSGYNPMTVNNYHTLEEILNKKKIQLVCVQYPMCSITPLKKIFQGQEEGLIFVDNEKSFKDAVSKSGYKEYFRDMFGGNFGHCTDKGNWLLAENIANVILKEVFGVNN